MHAKVITFDDNQNNWLQDLTKGKENGHSLMRMANKYGGKQHRKKSF